MLAGLMSCSFSSLQNHHWIGEGVGLSCNLVIFSKITLIKVTCSWLTRGDGVFVTRESSSGPKYPWFWGHWSTLVSPRDLVGDVCAALMALGACNRWASTEEAFVATPGNKSRSLLDWGYSQLLRSDFERSTSGYSYGVADQWFICRLVPTFMICSEICWSC